MSNEKYYISTCCQMWIGKNDVFENPFYATKVKSGDIPLMLVGNTRKEAIELRIAWCIEENKKEAEKIRTASEEVRENTFLLEKLYQLVQKETK